MSRRLRPLVSVSRFVGLLGLVGLSSGACATLPESAAPSSGGADFGGRFAVAFQAEAQDSTHASGYLDLLDLAVASPAAPGALAAALASVDALTSANLPVFEGLSPSAIAYRSREGFATVRQRLEQAFKTSEAHAPAPAAPFMRGAIASALHEMAMFVGDAPAAHRWARRRGCVQEATVIAPLDPNALRALDDTSPIDPSAALARSYAGIPPFAAAIAPTVVHADSCQIDATSTTPLQGMRAVVVDLAVPRAGPISIALTTSSAAVLDVGGVRAIKRGFDAGGRPVMRLATVNVVTPGTLRVVVRVAQRGDAGTVEIDAWGDDGQPLAAVAPRPGAAATGAAGSATAVELEPIAGGAEMVAAALLALGEVRAAEHALEPSDNAHAPERTPTTDLLYSRALEVADDMPDTKVVERSRAAVDRALAVWPNAWEAKLGRAKALERRRSSGEGQTEALRGLIPASPEPPIDPMIATYIALSAKVAQLRDVAENAYAELARRAPGSPLLATVDARIHARVGTEAVRAICNGGLRRADLDCFEAYGEMGDFPAAFEELERLRVLRDAAGAFRSQELGLRILAGDRAGALTVYDAMDPGERRMIDALALLGTDVKGDEAAARSRLARDKRTARDAPSSLTSLVRALGVEKDPAPALEAEGRRLVLADMKAAFLPGAGTAVLRHVETYGIDAGGLVHFLYYDLRRVSGTTDVAQGGAVYGPTIEGRSTARLLRKRIHKRDGRLLEPDAAANAQQASDLSQLEAGDYVEQIAEGWALPGDTGQLILDTPDLLPERTSVREAVLEVRRATKTPFALWAHPLLGAPEEHVDGEVTQTTWRIKDRAPRRIEDGVPKMERAVGLSLGTQTWAQVGRAFEETIRAFEDHDPLVTRWAHEVAGSDRTPSKALIDRVVAAAGAKVKVASGSELSDVASLYAGGSQKSNARTTLELGQGSRSWLIYRTLRELGVPVNLAIAETEPFSTVPTFPAHAGRFHHPLVIAKLGSESVWIDADVEGPPLPPGRISPELRGRSALLDTGAVVTIESAAAEMADEVDIRLALDEKGDARGNFTVLLHGRAAQGLAESFETVVGTERLQLLRKVVLAWLPWADVDDVAVSSLEGSWEVALRATIAIHGFGRPEGKDGKTWVVGGIEPVHAVFPSAVVGTLAASYASRGARQNALAIESPLQYHVHRRIELPPGAVVARAPAALEVVDANVSARRRMTQKGQILEEDFALSLPTGTVAAARYGAFVERVEAIDNGFMAGTRVRVK